MNLNSYIFDSIEGPIDYPARFEVTSPICSNTRRVINLRPLSIMQGKNKKCQFSTNFVLLLHAISFGVFSNVLLFRLKNRRKIFIHTLYVQIMVC